MRRFPSAAPARPQPARFSPEAARTWRLLGQQRQGGARARADALVLRLALCQHALDAAGVVVRRVVQPHAPLPVRLAHAEVAVAQRARVALARRRPPAHLRTHRPHASFRPAARSSGRTAGRSAPTAWGAARCRRRRASQMTTRWRLGSTCRPSRSSSSSIRSSPPGARGVTPGMYLRSIGRRRSARSRSGRWAGGARASREGEGWRPRTGTALGAPRRRTPRAPAGRTAPAGDGMCRQALRAGARQ